MREPHGSSEPGSWTFGSGLAQIFDDHVQRSVPGYLELHELCLSTLFRELGPSDLVYDVGCSTGTFTSRLKSVAPSARVIGIDSEQEMVAEATRRDDQVEFICASADTFEFQPARAIVALYVLQFLPPSRRLRILERIRRALGKGGLFIWAEKVRFDSPAEQARTDREYHAFKREQGFSEDEILAKARSLEGVLMPLTSARNETLLKQAGFASVEPLQSALCFRAWIARS